MEELQHWFTINSAHPESEWNEWRDLSEDMVALDEKYPGGRNFGSKRDRYEYLKGVFYAYLADQDPEPAPPPVIPEEPKSRWVPLAKATVGIVTLAGVVMGGTFLLGDNGETGAQAVTSSPQVTATTETVAATVPPEEAPVAQEAPPETTPPAEEEASETPGSGFVGNPATTILAFLVSRGSLVFTMTVEGDGQALAESPDTQWYQPVFEFVTADGAFTIDGTWAQGRPFKGRAFDENFKLIVDADITGEWTSPNTMVITADNFGSDELPALVRVILGVRVKDADGKEANYGDSAEWEQ